MKPLSPVATGVATAPPMRASQLLGVRAVWITPLLVAVGFVVSTWYDRRGLDRMAPEVLEFVHRSAEAYRSGAPGPATVDPAPADPPRS